MEKKSTNGSIGACKFNKKDPLFMRTPQNTPPFMAGMNAARG
jgi:hypothetical protein